MSHSPLVLMKRLNKAESAVFLYCKFSVFLKDPFFPDYFGMEQALTQIFVS